MHGSIKAEEDLFAAALALPPQERARYVRRACGKNHALIERVEQLLADADSAASFLDRAQWGFETLTAVSEGHADNEFGRYKLLYEIGEGGCGVVFLAEQTAPVRREVALKIIKLGMDTKAVISRFNAEQQALARMDHPNIAKVLDAGATPSGRPYFAMELVRGVKITKYCDQVCLSIAERLALFTQVCHAVQHAHHKGIVHRDIKPSNVLVTLHDGIPMVKVIDFGIAKATQGRLTDQTLYTAMDQFLGTPAYVSPEQIDTSLGEVDFRSDIYSLGVLLYELLAGCTPFSVPTWSFNNLDELRSRLRAQEPPIPSKRLRALAAEAQSTAALCRQTTTEKLIELVTGDLDWIVMRCLETDRERRYQSADEFAADVQRFLSNEPIAARPPSAVYSLRKFAERHRLAFAATASVMLILMIATILSAWLAVRAFRAEQHAQTETAAQQELISFLRNDLLAQASPEQEPDRDLKLRTVLDRAAEKIRGRFVDQPLVEASIRATLAETYQSLGAYAAAENHFRRALALYRQESGETDRNTLYVSRKVVGTLTDQGLYDQAVPLAQRVLAAHKQALGAGHQDTLEAMYSLARPLFLRGERAGGTQLLMETLEGYKKKLGPDRLETLEVMNGLGVFYLIDENPAAAQKLLVQALELRKRASGLAHPATIMVMSNLAAAYADMSRYAEAEPLMAQAVQLRQQILGADHPSTLASINNLATLYADQGKLEESAHLQARGIELGQHRLGAKHPSVLLYMNNLGRTYLDQEKLDSAYEVLKKTLKMRQEVLGPEHPDTLVSLSNLGLVQHRRGKLARAEALLTRAWANSDQVLGADSPTRLVIGERLGAVLLDRKEFSEAEPLLRVVSESRSNLFPADWRTFVTRTRLGDALIGLGRYAEAESVLISAHRELLQRLHSIPENQRTVLKSTTDSISRLYVVWQRPDKRSRWERELHSKS